ncbi:ABC transporter substrate-binding protein [Actinophytocola gossypii]|uniref:ABC transporter substrate-binding protein n=1 Tax=Actinophytocola gossypii TaxID=2812003 RepID=A0ABT2JBN2_9PSEU|nr:ABC transporter substrate-binding protein [Actinophytocola gossypii]MCT2585276.1 ABC transporter substrate-binding protein [Actinophytocola gossypii]
MPTLSFRRLVPSLLAVVLLAGACTGDPAPPASGDPDGTSLVIAVAEEPTALSPLAGYGLHGAAKVFDGLVEHADDLTLRPALATGLPAPSANGRTWTVRLRPGVTFSDGTPFDAQDVVATYRAVLDQRDGSPLRQRFSMLDRVVADDSSTVHFELSEPYAPFPELLVLGIVSSESVGGDDPPVGTGPYVLADWQRGTRMVLEANEDHWDGTPAITEVTVEFVPGDEARADRMREGKLDGAALPPALAREFENTDGLQIVSHSAADVHAVVLPSNHPVTGDPAVRLALNHAMDRATLVDDALAGQGRVAHTPMPGVLAEFVEPGAVFEHDLTRALDQLESSGWVTGADGIRVRDGRVAEFTLTYLAGDMVARRMAEAFAAGARSVGIQVEPSPVAAEQLSGASLVGFGDPFDPDTALYRLLHSGGSLGGYANDTVDEALEVGRTATDPALRATAYRRMQRAYVQAPGMVVLAAPNHTYVMRESWDGYEPVVDGSSAGATWGAWWNLAEWTPR